MGSTPNGPKHKVALNSYGGLRVHHPQRVLWAAQKVAFSCTLQCACQVLVKPPLLLSLVLRSRHHSNPGSHSKRGLALWYKTFWYAGLGYSGCTLCLPLSLYVWTSDCRSRAGVYRFCITQVRRIFFPLILQSQASALSQS